MTDENGAFQSMHTQEAPDWAVVQEVTAGDVDAFEILLRRHSASVFRIVSRRIPRNDIEAVAQDVFVGAFRSLGTYEGRQPFENWIAIIARRRCCDYWRERERRGDLAHAGLRETESVEVDVAGQAFRRDNDRKRNADLIRESLHRLGCDDRALIESIYFEDLPLKEVAASFGWSLVKVKVRVHRIRRRLRDIARGILTELGDHETERV